jgi:DNA mismatch endonuclease (patch repair protein)
MIDRLSPQARSANMGKIRGRNTCPEIAVRRILRQLGVGYRLHVATLPGCPDIAMTGRCKVIEVRGCFWHQHPGCGQAYMPKTRSDFWRKKFLSTRIRDRRNEEAISALGYGLLIVWECETSNIAALTQRIVEFLELKKTTL